MGPAIIYYLVLSVLVAGINLFWDSIFDFSSLMGSIFETTAARESNATTRIVEFLLTPLFALGALFLAAGVTHLMLKLFRDGEQGFQTTTRVFAYSYSPAVFAVVPVLGGIVGFVWMIGIAIIGLREAHETDGAKAAAAVLIPVFFLLFTLVLAFVAGVALGVLKMKL